MSDGSSSASSRLDREEAVSMPENTTAALLLADGSIFWGTGFGAPGQALGEICFNTSMTGYQEIISDPSSAGLIITFTFPHIGNAGINPEDSEGEGSCARGVVLGATITDPASWRARERLDRWLEDRNLPGIAGIDTRAVTRRIRMQGACAAAIIHAPDGSLDLSHLLQIGRAHV